MKIRELDQFYTKFAVAENYYEILNGLFDVHDYDVVLEPSAGMGAFFKLLPEKSRIGLDLEPKMKGITECDFFKYKPDYNKSYLTIGNPPFGKNSSLAIKFFNRCSEFSNVIAFIVPLTFNKISVINKLNVRFHCVFNETLEKNSFEFMGIDYDVPCCFQIWEQWSIIRKPIRIITKHKDFVFSDKLFSDFAIQRVGVNAGQIKFNVSELSKESHYFIKQTNESVLEIMEEIDFNVVKHNTAGNPSISKHEIVSLYKNMLTNQE